MLLPQVLGDLVGTAVSTSLAAWASKDRAEMQCSVDSMIRGFVSNAIGVSLKSSGAIGALETWGRNRRNRSLGRRNRSLGRRSRVARQH